jgi:serine/threonine-protein kinase
MQDRSPDLQRAGDTLATIGDPQIVPDGAGGAGIPAAGSSSAVRYQLGEEIARGGMGVVCRATDTVLGREVAVKVLQGKYAADSATALRFVAEARITGPLQHPGIPAIHDLGILPDGRPFLAMKLIKGETLDQLLRRGAAAEGRGRVVAVFEQVCQALAYAHARGVLRRDLKPSNIMVGAFGEVQVMDWGLAKVLAPGQAAANDAVGDPLVTLPYTEVRPLLGGDLLTHSGSVLGTPAYMPPEQAIGAVDQIDARSDVFGLGNRSRSRQSAGALLPAACRGTARWTTWAGASCPLLTPDPSSPASLRAIHVCPKPPTHSCAGSSIDCWAVACRRYA